MGNECTSCFNKAGDNKIEDLSYKNPIINKIIQEQNENQNQDLSYINMEIKENERFIENNENDNNKKILLKSQIKEIPPEYITKLNKYIRGHLLRLLYKNKLKLQLENFQNNLYNKFLQISKNELVEKTLYNKEKNEILSENENLNWNDFYKENPNKEIEEKILKKKLYNESLIFKYVKKERDENKIDDLIEKTKYIYKGQTELFSGKKTGKGKKIYKDGSIIIGTFYNNKANGFNKYINSKGDFFLGFFKENKLNGKGIKISLANNYYFKGNFKDNLKEGKGKEKINNNIYEGNFENDKKNGEGKLVLETGDYYEGNFLDNKFNGQGHYYWKKNNNEYFGNYLNGIFHGEGFYKWNENEYYKGEYKNGIKEGKGEIKFKDGKKFICTFVNGKPNGIGFYENEKGKRKEVEFINGKINKNYKKKNNNMD